MTPPKRRFSTTWVLAGAAALLGGYVYLVEVRGGEREERAQTAITHLLPFRPEAATELVLQRPDGRIICRKERGRWRLVAPVRSDADDTTISRLLQDVAEARVDRTVTAHPRDVATFGLAHPVVLAVAAGAQRQSIQIGKANPTGSFVFARRGDPGTGAQRRQGGPVLLVEQRVRDATQKTLYDLRDKTVLEFDPEDVTGMTISARGQTIRLVRSAAPPAKAPPQEADAKGWKLVQPLRARADRGMVERTFNLVSYLRAEQFVSEQPVHLEQYGLAPPWGQVRFDMKGGRSERLLLGRKTETGALTRYFARRPGPGPIFTINDNLPQDAMRAPAEWRERHVTDFVRADVAELRLISPTQTVVCVKVESPSGDEWHLAEFAGRVAEGMNLGAAARMPTAQRADRDRVDGLLGHLATLEVAAFLDGASPAEPRFGLAQPGLKVVALDKSSHPLASVAFGAPAGTRQYATSPHLGGVFLVAASDAGRFRVATRDLAARS